MSQVKTRIAPSPTGGLHIGTARTALFNFLYAKKTGGKFVLRIEDTDAARSLKEHEDDIYEQMKWLGYEYDEKYVQSEHREEHTRLLQKLIESDRAYISSEPAKDDPSRMVEVVRLRNPGGTITFTDEVRGDIAFDVSELRDFVIARNISDPLYHFAVVADDGAAEITHVIRGDDHISNTPRQILIQEALGLPRPVYAHLPLILMPDKSKMSKRKHQTSVANYRAQGYLPEAMNNFLALLGWSPGEGDRELFSMDDLIHEFDVSRIHTSGAVFNEEKLRWFNREYLIRMEETHFDAEATARMKEALTGRVTINEDRLRALLPIVRERLSVWSDIRTLAEAGEFDYYFAEPLLDPHKLVEKKSTAEDTREHLSHIIDTLGSVAASDFHHEAVKAAIWEYASERGRGAVLWPMRYALSGKDKSPDPFVLSEALGKEETMHRLERARAIL